MIFLRASRTRELLTQPAFSVVDMNIVGLDPQLLSELRSSRVDHGNNAVEAFTDDRGGWPLRRCLRDSRAGDSIAIAAWNPFPWRGPFAETGPIVVHVGTCDSYDQTNVPTASIARAPLYPRSPHCL